MVGGFGSGGSGDMHHSRPRIVSINRLLGQVKSELRGLLAAETISEHCRAVGHRWRRSALNPAMVSSVYPSSIGG